jgi:glycosyltransferase involved in cell wall biosynthesis
MPESILKVGVDVRCLARDFSPGIARFTRCIAAALAERDDVEVVGYSDRPLRWEVPFPVAVLPARLAVAWEHLRLPRALRRDRADVLLSPANRGLPAVSRVPSVLVLHDAEEWDRAFPGPLGARARFHFAYASVISLARATHIVTVSQYSCRRIVERLRIPPARLTVVPGAVDPSLLRSVGEDEVEALRTRYGLASPTVLYVGGAHPKKRVHTLIDGFAALPGRGAQLVLAGQFSPETFQDAVARHGISDRTVFTGPVAEFELPALYRAADIFVFPAVFEGFGLPALEAMACGLPVVLARSGALPEVGGKAATLFDPDDPLDLAGALDGLLASDELRARRSVEAKARAGRFSWATSAEELAAILHRASRIPLSGRALAPAARLRHARRWARPA